MVRRLRKRDAIIHRRRERLRLRVDRIENLRIVGPLHILRRRGTFLRLLQFLKQLQLTRHLIALRERPVHVVQLEMRRRQIAVQRNRLIELRDGLRQLIRLPQQDTQVVVRNRLVRRELHHLLELRHRLLEIAVLLVHDAEIEVRMRQIRVLLLDLLQLLDALFGLAAAQQCEPVIQLLAL